jgi:hypothetical protein
LAPSRSGLDYVFMPGKPPQYLCRLEATATLIRGVPPWACPLSFLYYHPSGPFLVVDAQNVSPVLPHQPKSKRYYHCSSTPSKANAWSWNLQFHFLAFGERPQSSSVRCRRYLPIAPHWFSLCATKKLSHYSSLAGTNGQMPVSNINLSQINRDTTPHTVLFLTV